MSNCNQRPNYNINNLITVSGFSNTFIDTFTTGGTYNYSANTITFNDNQGGSFNVTGITTTDIFVTGGTYDYSANTITFINNSGGTFNVTGITTTDTFTTGGTYNYSANTITFNDNQGGSFNVTGITTTDTFTTGGTYVPSATTLTLNDNQGGNVSISGFSEAPTGLEVIDEGNGNGWRLIGRNPDFYGDIGFNSIDFSNSTISGNTMGALGDYGFVSGFNNIIQSGVTGSTILGGSNITGDTNDTVSVPNLRIVNHPPIGITDTVLSRADDGSIVERNLAEITRLTYAELKALKDAGDLIPFKRYIITDYVHKYQIFGSNSSEIKQNHVIIGSAGAYTQFTNVPANVAVEGTTATVVSVPSGATISVGQTFTIIDYWNEAYIRFSPSITSGVNFGAVLQFGKQRYSNVTTNTTILDAYSKPVIKPNGVINTDVHDDTPYMDMIGSENPSPITEEIVVLALDESTISINAESVTFLGDELTYEFDNNTINDEDGNVITGVTRNGFITRRKNTTLNIDIDKDWRNQRYRRYKLSNSQWSELMFSSSNASLYTIGGANFGTTPTYYEEGHKYMMLEPEEVDFYLDFYSSGNTDIFLSGETGTPSSTLSSRLGGDETNSYLKDIFLETSGLTYAKDFTIIPLVNYQPSSVVKMANIGTLNNTVFRTLNQRYGISADYNINIPNGGMYSSSVNTGGNFYGTGNLIDCKIFDYSGINNENYIYNLLLANYSTIENKGLLRNIRICGYVNYGLNNFVDLRIDNTSTIVNTIFGISRGDNIKINNSSINRCMFLGTQYNVVDINAQMYCTSFNLNGVINSSKININNFNKQIPNKGFFGVKHNVTSFNNIVIDDNVDNLVLVNRITDATFITSITQIGTTQ